MSTFSAVAWLHLLPAALLVLVLRAGGCVPLRSMPAGALVPKQRGPPMPEGALAELLPMLPRLQALHLHMMRPRLVGASRKLYSVLN